METVLLRTIREASQGGSGVGSERPGCHTFLCVEGGVVLIFAFGTSICSSFPWSGFLSF